MTPNKMSLYLPLPNPRDSEPKKQIMCCNYNVPTSKGIAAESRKPKALNPNPNSTAEADAPSLQLKTFRAPSES